MNKVIHIATSAVVSAACMGSFASAATCDGIVTLTGPDSNNTVSCNDVNNINVTCNNNLWVGTVNNQTGSSGSGDVSGNTTGGNVATGTVVNDNGQNVTIGTSCNGADGGGGVGVASTPTPSAPENPSGAGSTTPSVLPYTANDTPLSIAVTGIVTAAGAYVATRLGIIAFRHYKLK
ncbi:MAG: hypothetical protein H6797_01030 [Candidatus Nomurabacteria bacterium]|nr:MAG: hypothetical protein H6797_01030 [Candidatus Nomurabacteria bacterium]